MLGAPVVCCATTINFQAKSFSLCYLYYFVIPAYNLVNELIDWQIWILIWLWQLLSNLTVIWSYKKLVLQNTLIYRLYELKDLKRKAR